MSHTSAEKKLISKCQHTKNLTITFYKTATANNSMHSSIHVPVTLFYTLHCYGNWSVSEKRCKVVRWLAFVSTISNIKVCPPSSNHD